MPSRSEAQRKMIFAKRSKYKTKEKTPEKDKWIWDKGYENKGDLPEKVEEGLVQRYLKKIYSESLMSPMARLSNRDFEISTDDVGTGKRGMSRKVYITYTNPDDGEVYEGEIILGHGSKGRGESYNYVSHIEWDNYYNDGKDPDNYEEIEEFISDRLDFNTMTLN